MTEYVVLLMGDAERWWNLSEEERTAGYGAHTAFAAQLEERGHRMTGGAIEVRRCVTPEERAS